MRDEGLTVGSQLEHAQAAVKYILKRITVDPDLRHHMIGTEAYDRLCLAEASRIGKTLDQVKEAYWELAPHCRGERAQLVEMRERLEALEAENDDATYDEVHGAEDFILNFIENYCGRKARHEAELKLKYEASQRMGS
jgi:hypothetical protein